MSHPPHSDRTHFIKVDPYLLQKILEQDEEAKTASYDDFRKVSLSTVHPHELVFNNGLTNHSCDVCKKSAIGQGYRCRGKECDFDCCQECIVKAITA